MGFLRQIGKGKKEKKVDCVGKCTAWHNLFEEAQHIDHWLFHIKNDPQHQVFKTEIFLHKIQSCSAVALKDFQMKLAQMQYNQ